MVLTPLVPIEPSTTTHVVGPGRGLTILFFTFHILGGLVGLPLVVINIILSRQLTRHPALLNFCITWTVGSLVYSLLLYSGQQGNHDTPFNLCLAQASMVNGAFPMTSVAGLALISHIWHGLQPSRTISHYGIITGPKLRTARLALVLVAPYVVFAIFAISAAAVGHNNPSLLQASDTFFYCTLDSKPLNTAVPAFTAVVIVAILIIEALICAKVYRQFHVFRRTGILRKSSVLFLMRLAGFTIYACIALGTTAFFLTDSRNFTPYIIQASLPLAVFLILGTQTEILEVWLQPCRHRITSHRRNMTASQHGLSSTAGLARNSSRASASSSFFSSNVGGVDGDLGELGLVALDSPPLTNRRTKSCGETYLRFDKPEREDALDHEDGLRAKEVSQQRTIDELLREKGEMMASLDRFKSLETTSLQMHSLLMKERETTARLRSYLSKIEQELHWQNLLAKNLRTSKKELAEGQNLLKEEVQWLRKEKDLITSDLEHCAKREEEWRSQHHSLEAEHTRLCGELESVKKERDSLFDIWSTLDSPVDWALQKPKSSLSQRNPSTPTLLEAAEQIRQRYSQPNLRKGSTFRLSQAHRRTRFGAGVPMDRLDQLRPRLLQLSGNLELSEKVSSLEEMVRQQSAIIDDLESSVEEERRCKEEERQRRIALEVSRRRLAQQKTRQQLSPSSPGGLQSESHRRMRRHKL